MTKAEASSPTISLEAMMLSCTTDAKEGRYIMVTNIPGAFLHADMDQDVYMLLEGTIAELIFELEPMLRSIVNRSATTKQEMPTYDRAIRDMKNGANQYRVLEDSDEEGTYNKVQNVQFNNERE